MSACPSLSYANIDQAKWVAIKAAVIAEMPSLAPMVDAGSGEHDGVTIAWVYAENTLTLTATDSPWWASCAMINGEIDGLIRPLLLG
jgi:hypothetical protein